MSYDVSRILSKAPDHDSPSLLESSSLHQDSRYYSTIFRQTPISDSVSASILDPLFSIRPGFHAQEDTNLRHGPLFKQDLCLLR